MLYYNIYADETKSVTLDYTVKKCCGDDVYVITTYSIWSPLDTPFVALTKPEYELYMNAPTKFDVNDYHVYITGLEYGEYTDVVVTKNGVAFTDEQYDDNQVYLEIKDKIDNNEFECLVNEHDWTFVREVRRIEGHYELELKTTAETPSDSE